MIDNKTVVGIYTGTTLAMSYVCIGTSNAIFLEHYNNEIVFLAEDVDKINDNFEEIAELIYQTNPYIYPYWFNNNINEGITKLKESQVIMKDGQNKIDFETVLNLNNKILYIQMMLKEEKGN